MEVLQPHPFFTRSYWRRSASWLLAWPVLCLGVATALWYSADVTDARRLARLMAALLLGFSAVATALMVRITLLHHRQLEERDAYRLIAEGSQESFYLLRALFNGRGEICDFRLIDCNESAAAIFGLDRARFIGATVSSLYQGDYFQRMMTIYLHAMREGSFEDEYRVPRNSPLVRSQWLHRRFARAGSNLAMSVRDITDAKLYQHELLRMANEDALTALPNQHWLMGYLPKALEQAVRQRTMLALFFIDPDGFKDINDTYGHAAGDAVLGEIAQRMAAMLRSDDRAVRLGGDEFMFLIERVQSRDLLEDMARRAVANLTQPVSVNGVPVRIGASIGISVFPDDGNTVEALLGKADRAMYAVKKAGKGGYRFTSDLAAYADASGAGASVGPGSQDSGPPAV